MMVRRDPETTRAELIEAAFDEMHVNGFQATGLGQILDRTGVTKGALYHHFSNKQELGLAVLDECVRPMILRQFEGIDETDDPISVIIAAMYRAMEEHSGEMLNRGCPLNNLTQEMSDVDESFRLRIEEIIRMWHDIIARGIQRGIDAGSVRSDVDAAGVAAFLIATWEGMAGLGKGTRDMELVVRGGKVVETFMQSLRPADVGASP